MATINCEQLFKNRLDGIWGNAQSLSTVPSHNSIISRGYAIERDVETDSILFVSMNPSFSDNPNAWNNGNRHASAFYKIPWNSKGIAGTNPFFIAINDFYNSLNITRIPKPRIAHHDLLFVRETSQKSVLDMKKDPNLKSFFNDQLGISKNIIEKSTPALIVVLNAGARELFKDLFKKEFKGFDQRKGANTYIINGNETPVLFSGMLSGQHPLDLGSKESLKWHIEYILN